MTDPRSSNKKDLAIGIELRRPTTVSEVEKHNQAVGRPGADRKRYRGICGRCGHGDDFAPHDVRRRGLRLLIGNTVLCMTVWLARWRCRKCRRVWTDYPDFRTPL